MKKKLLTLVLLFTLINTAVSQNMIELIAIGNNGQKTSNPHISEIEFKIVTKHKRIYVDSTMFFPVPYKFETMENEVKVEYYNIFNQKLDTIFNITSGEQKLFLNVEKIKDYEIKTFLELSLLENKIWKLKLSGGGCFVFTDTEIKIIPRKNGAILKYKYEEERGVNRKKIKENKIIKLDKYDLANLIRFEKKLRLLNSGIRRCAPGTYYYLSLGRDTIRIKDETCIGLFQEYLSKIIERNN